MSDSQQNDTTQQITSSSPETTSNANFINNSSPLSLDSPKLKTSSKITVLLKSVGDAPILKRKNWEVDENWTAGFFQQILRKILKLTLEQSLFIFINQSFSPSPEHTMGQLNECFGGESGKLTIYYSTTLAWG